MDIKGLVINLCEQFNTRDPFEIARQRNIVVLFESLGGVHGYYAMTHRQQVIHINQCLDEPRQRFTCSHELGHALLHPNTNTPFLRAATMYSIDKLEIQANRFAVDMLFDDYSLQPYLSRSITDAASYMGVTLALAEYRMKSVEPCMPEFFEY